MESLDSQRAAWRTLVVTNNWVQDGYIYNYDDTAGGFGLFESVCLRKS